MTKREKYIEEQKTCGIEVGDEVRAMRQFGGCEGGHSAGSSHSWRHKVNFIDAKAIGTVTRVEQSYIEVACGNEFGGLWNFPYFVLEIVKKKDGSDIKIGDEVRVFRNWKQGENGVLLTQLSDMKLGTVGKVIRIDSTSILMNGYFWPLSVIEIVKKANGDVPSKDNTNVKEPCRDCKHIDSDVCDEPTKITSRNTTRVVFDECVITNSTNRKESNMSTQEQTVFDVTVIERTEVLHKGSGVVEKINRTVLFDEKVSAVTAESAKQQALQGVEDPNFDDLEITCRPFCAD